MLKIQILEPTRFVLEPVSSFKSSGVLRKLFLILTPLSASGKWELKAPEHLVSGVHCCLAMTLKSDAVTFCPVLIVEAASPRSSCDYLLAEHDTHSAIIYPQ